MNSLASLGVRIGHSFGARPAQFHLDFEIMYVYRGVVQKFRPDFLIRLANGTMLVLEVKGQDTPQNRTKREFLAEWVRAVNNHGGFGHWAWDVSFDPADIGGLLPKHGGGGP